MFQYQKRRFRNIQLLTSCSIQKAPTHLILSPSILDIMNDLDAPHNKFPRASISLYVGLDFPVKNKDSHFSKPLRI